jgi:hypothetical protein
MATKRTRDSDHGRRLLGSERPRPTSHAHVKPLADDEQVAFNFVVRRRPGAPKLPDMAHWQSAPLRERKFLTPEDYAATFGARQADIDAIANFARSNGLTVLRSHAGRRSVVVLGSAAQINKLFGIELQHYQDPYAPPAAGAHGGKRNHRGFDGPIHLPAELADIVVAAVGLDNRHFGHPQGALGDPSGAGSPLGPKIAGSYNFPNLTVPDQTIGVIAPQPFGSPGSPPCYNPPDIAAYIKGLPAGYNTQPAAIHDVDCIVGPTTYLNNQSVVTAVTSLSGVSNAILELTQDISTSAGIAQGATINVYFTESSENGFLEFFNRALLPDPGENRPTVLTMSFGIKLGDDASGTSLYTGIGTLTPQRNSSSMADQMSTLLAELTAVGLNVCYAIGDWGSGNWFPLANTPPGSPPDGAMHVSYPGTDPSVTACGGTLLGTTQESAWSDAYSTTSGFGNPNNNFGSTGGGVSATFPSPSYQTAAGITGAVDSSGASHQGRGVPDIAGHVSYSGFFVNTIPYNYIGTSCVAPLYAGLVAQLQSALGLKLGALNTTLYALQGAAFNTITGGDNDPHTTTTNVKKTIPTYSGPSPEPAFFKVQSGWNACTGLGSVNGTNLLNGIASLLYNKTYYFQVNKGSYGLEEVKINLTYSSPTPMWLVLEGFTPNAFTAANVKPSVISAVTGLTVTVAGPQFEIETQLDTPQRIYFPCTVTFTSTAAQSQSQGGVFPDATDPPTSFAALLIAPSFSVAGELVQAAETNLTLDQGADPYFANFANNGYFYLSQDLRVFTVCPGIPAQKAPIDGIPLNASSNTSFDTQAAYSYIQSLLGHLNTTYASLSAPDAFSKFPDQSDALSGDSSVTPTQVDPANPSGNTPFTNYNFAVARVRVAGTPSTVTAANVRVLFRLFTAQTSDTDYQLSTYPATTDGDGQPLAPLVSAGAVTIPFFATGNYEANSDFGVNTDYSGTSLNNQPVNIDSTGESFAYYGCYLNIYPTGNTITTSAGQQAVQTLLPSTHNCIVAQLVYDDAPYPTGPGVVLGPEWSSTFAQRNLQVTYSDNPGPASTHLVPQTFDIRPGPAPGSGPLENYPDELWIDWGDTPIGSQASIYWPAVASSDVLALASQFYSTHQLSASDAHTITCTVPKGITSVPIPTGGSANYAGLFTVQLPQGVIAGQAYTIVVRRVSTKAGTPPPPPPPPPPPIQGQIPQGRLPQRAQAGQAPATPVTPAATGQTMYNSRYVVGSFGVRIPVTTAKVMLPAEENTYSILKWRLSQMPPSDRWIPVLKRYLEISARRIIGLNGHPHKILPSPWGVRGPPEPDHGGKPGRHERHATGKVVGVIYDRFGDFEGFHLLTEEGHERTYFSHEDEIETLARYAWFDRVVITVVSDEAHPEVPVRIILRRAPSPRDIGARH